MVLGPEDVGRVDDTATRVSHRPKLHDHMCMSPCDESKE